MQRSIASVAAFAVLTATARASAAAAELPRPALPPCSAVTATLDTAIDSAKANVGDVFTFSLAGTPSSGGAAAVATGAKGYGVVSYAKHADRAPGGALALEARYFRNPDGSKVAATIIASYALDRGSNRDLPFVFALTGLFHSAITSALSAAGGLYGFAHRGSEASLQAGTPLRVVIGDGLTERTCSATLLLQGPLNYRAP